MTYRCAYPACDRPGSVLRTVSRKLATGVTLALDFGVCTMHDRSPLARSTATAHAMTRAVRQRGETTPSHANSPDDRPSSAPIR